MLGQMDDLTKIADLCAIVEYPTVSLGTKHFNLLRFIRLDYIWLCSY